MKVVMMSLLTGALGFGHMTEDPSDITPITSDEVIDALTTWSDGIVEIGAIYSSGGNHTYYAMKHLVELYAYDIVEPPSVVLFKPTLASEIQFRHTIEGALSYFFGDNPNYPEDNGFAIAPYVAVRHEISGIFIDTLGS